MDILRVLQTLGICVGAVALVAIAVMLFLVVVTFMPGPPPEIEDIESLNVMTLDRASRRKKTRNKKVAVSPDPASGENEPPDQPS